MRKIYPTFLLLISCDPNGTFGGTAVGNPTGMDIALAEGKGMSISHASMSVSSIDIDTCDGSWKTVEVAHNVDLLQVTPIMLPGAHVCGVRLIPEGNLGITATDGVHTFQASLQLPLLQISTTNLAQPALILELGSPAWIDAAQIGLNEGDVAVSMGHPLYDGLIAALVSGSALYADTNENGQIDDAERESHATAQPDNIEDTAGHDTAEEPIDTGDVHDSSDSDTIDSEESAGDTSGDTSRDTASQTDSGQDSTGDSDTGHDSGTDSQDSSPSDSGDSAARREPQDTGH